jgi:hypothetical protein
MRAGSGGAARFFDQLPALHKNDESVVLVNVEQLPVRIAVGGVIVLQEKRIDEAGFKDGHHGFQFFTRFQVAAAFFLEPVDRLHGAPHGLRKDFAVQRLCQIVQDAQAECFLGVVELVIGGHDEENGVGTEAFDLPDGLDPVDPGHLDVHHGDVGTEVLGSLDHGAAGLGGAQFAGFRSKFC